MCLCLYAVYACRFIHVAFSGEIPVGLSKSSLLLYVLDAGEIPSSLGQLSNLTYLTILVLLLSPVAYIILSGLKAAQSKRVVKLTNPQMSLSRTSFDCILRCHHRHSAANGGVYAFVHATRH